MLLLLLLLLMMLLHVDGMLLHLQLFEQQLLFNRLLQSHLDLGHPLWYRLRQHTGLQMLTVRLHLGLGLRL